MTPSEMNRSLQNNITREMRLEYEVERLTALRNRIADVLFEFAASELSISAIQPLLALNDELNGGAK